MEMGTITWGLENKLNYLWVFIRFKIIPLPAVQLSVGSYGNQIRMHGGYVAESWKGTILRFEKKKQQTKLQTFYVRLFLYTVNTLGLETTQLFN